MPGEIPDYEVIMGEIHAQLEKVQKENGRLKDSLDSKQQTVNTLFFKAGQWEAERDAAIELGVRLWQFVNPHPQRYRRALETFEQQKRQAEAREVTLREALDKVTEQAGGALEIAANDLEALDAGVEVTERGDKAPWAQARSAINALFRLTRAALGDE